MRDVFTPRGRYSQVELAPLAALDLDGDGQRTILVAVDGHESSLRAAAYAIGLARRQGLRLVVLYVHTLGPLASTPDSINAIRAANAEAVRAVRIEMDRQGAALGVDIAVVERDGSPYFETVRLAGELRVDAVVMGGGRNFGYQYFGSPATRLVRNAQWPITVIP